MENTLKRFTVNGGFFGRYQQLAKDTIIPHQEKAIKDELAGAEKSHAVENFRHAAEVIKTGKCSGEFYGMVFQDSDVAKWLEAAAYSLALFPDSELEKRCDEVIDLIAEAQHDDGYLNTYFTVKAPEKRWTNLAEAHELYCAGHMMEAAVAYAQCTGKTKLLDIMERMTAHIYKRFVTDGAEGYPGHPEIELALMRMYKCTGDKKHLELAGHFINVRGVNPHYFGEECKKRDWQVWGLDCGDTEYAQNNAPVRELEKATGHSVRAVYLYAGMADYAAVTGDESLVKACETLWCNIVQKRMYVTGAIGSAYEGEAFTADYHLPNDTAYAETCASIGLIFFARKMLDLQKRGEYADIMERALYNCVLAGMELDGTKFFYVNPLEVLPGISGMTKTHWHAKPERPSWFVCACCPPNVARLLTSIGEYAWSLEEKEDVIYSHLFINGELDGKIAVETNFPFDGKVTYKFKQAVNQMLAIRLPFWSENTQISCEYEAKDGYAYIKGAFAEGDVITVDFDMSVKRIYADSNVSANNGKVAFSRGALIYCAEGVDNGGEILNLAVKKNGAVSIEDNNLKAEGFRLKNNGDLYSFNSPEAEPCTIKLVPYYTWGNRGLNQMRVWIPEN
ncbi:MAG: glycoside hydrolase family 127 protein [Oscillospiraceae bacterium]|nr:glycoside hydrolase family 127 protein [Oscillospiraceae bacterium]